MAELQQDAEAVWSAVVQELTALAERPNSAIPTFTPAHRLTLRRVKAIMINDGYALLAAPDERCKALIENELQESITYVLQQFLNRPYSVSVSLTMPEQKPTAQQASSTPSQFERTPPFPASAGKGEPQISPTQQPGNFQWNQTYSQSGPSNLDELAHSFSGQQSPRIPREEPAHDPNRETSLNPHHTFENFVIGSSNRFANGAAVAVAESPAHAYNPLFIWGGSGLGKTHLLHAAGNYAKLLHPGLRVKYVSSEEFTNDYINSIRDDRQESFKRRYRNLDILMVDDIQFLEGKESTQEEFFHTFNALHQANKQIILSSDRPPKELNTLEDRLRTRFEGGLITDVQPPDLETRIAILMKKAESEGTQISPDILELIASRFESSIRELEGALIRVSAYASLAHQPITMETAELALRDLLPDSEGRQVTPSTILNITAEYFDIAVSDLCGTGKKRRIAHARQLAMYLCRELTELSLPKIGEEFGGKDHTTVIYAQRKISKEMNENRNTYKEIQELTSKIQSAPKG